MSDPILEVQNLVVEYTTPRGRVRSLDDATLVVEPGLVGVVGESGCGKTTLGMAAGRLLASNAQVVSGALRVDGTSVLDADSETTRRLRRDVLGYVFQNPISALDPTMRIERQMKLAAKGKRAGGNLRQALADVGLLDVDRVLRSYPHQLSGGMAQRVGIAIALSRRPRLLIADEPTAAVDATLRAQILDLLVERCRELECALLLVTHDLHAVAEHTHQMAVMYAGRIVEAGPTKKVITDPVHPYTRALLHALPGEEPPGTTLEGIAGLPPVLDGPSRGCAFAERCQQVLDSCHSQRPVPVRLGDREATCHLVAGHGSGQEQPRLNGTGKNDVRDAVNDVLMIPTSHGVGGASA